MKILVTGGAGFIGSYVVRNLAELGHKVTIVDRSYDNYLLRFPDKPKKIKFCRSDISVKDVVDFIFDVEIPEVIVHLAADSVAKTCDESPEDCMDNNIGAITNVLLYAGKHSHVRRIVYISSSYVYGDFISEPVNEDHPKNPIGIYGGTKLAGEILTQSFCSRFNKEWVIVRPSAVYGETDKNHRVVQVLLDRAINNKTLYLDGVNQRLDFTYVEDVANGICLATLKEDAKDDVFNITRGQGRTLGELSEIISQLLPCKIEYKEADKQVPRRGALDIVHANVQLDYFPQWDLEDGVKKYYEWMAKI